MRAAPPAFGNFSAVMASCPATPQPVQAWFSTTRSWPFFNTEVSFDFCLLFFTELKNALKKVKNRQDL
jgi:hypothetical protein